MSSPAPADPALLVNLESLMESPIATRIPATAPSRRCPCGRSARWLLNVSSAPACSRCVTAAEERGLASGELVAVPCSGGALVASHTCG